MVASLIIARPYAKAAFEFALEQKNIKSWAQLLQTAALIATHADMKTLLSNPLVLPKNILEVFDEILKPDKYEENFLKLLEDYRHLHALPEIFTLFKRFQQEHEKSIDVDVIAAYKLTSKQEQALTKALAHCLQKKVSVRLSIDKMILGGAIIRAGSFVVNGSGFGRLTRLKLKLK